MIRHRIFEYSNFIESKCCSLTPGPKLMVDNEKAGNMPEDSNKVKKPSGRFVARNSSAIG